MPTKVLDLELNKYHYFFGRDFVHFINALRNLIMILLCQSEKSGFFLKTSDGGWTVKILNTLSDVHFQNKILLMRKTLKSFTIYLQKIV